MATSDLMSDSARGLVSKHFAVLRFEQKWTRNFGFLGVRQFILRETAVQVFGAAPVGSHTTNTRSLASGVPRRGRRKSFRWWPDFPRLSPGFRTDTWTSSQACSGIVPGVGRLWTRNNFLVNLKPRRTAGSSSTSGPLPRVLLSARQHSVSAAWFGVGMLVWFTANTVPADKLNVLQLIVLVLFSGLANPNLIGNFSTARLGVFLVSGFFLSGLSLTTSLIIGGFSEGLRQIALVVLTILVGVFFGAGSHIRAVLAGVGGGTIMLLANGIYVQWLDPARQLLSGSYVGVSGRESDQLLNAIVGLGIGLALLNSFSRRAIAPAALAVASLVTVLRLDMLAGFIALLLLVGIRLIQLFIPAERAIWLLRLSLFLAVLGGLVTPLLLSQRSRVVRAAEWLGSGDSLDARLAIWDSALKSVSHLGALVGHGHSFWVPGTSSEALTAKLLARNGLPAFGNAHSAYVDLFLSFGVVGSTVLLISLVLLIVLMRPPGSGHWHVRWLFPCLAIGPLAVLGFTESVLVLRPPGWLLIGLLLGMLFSLPEQRNFFGTRHSAG